MIRVGIMGGDVPVAGELIRILINHPDVEISWVQSSEYDGIPLTEIHKGLLGETYMRFTGETRWDEINMLFCTQLAGDSRKLIDSGEVPADIKIVDLSEDYRMADGSHDFIYGLPELNRKSMVRGGTRVACPGSFAAVIELALLPLAKNLMLNHPIHVAAITSSSDDDATPDLGWRHSLLGGNLIAYKPLEHPQLAEVRQTLQALQSSFNAEIDLVTFRGTFPRGLMAVTYMECPIELDEVRKLYEDYYSDHSFTFVTSKEPDLHDVINTNKCILQLDKVDGKLVIVAAIDNLGKGSAGQAVHNMNLIFGLQERVGLALKSSAY